MPRSALRLAGALRDTFLDAAQVSRDIFKVLVPIIIGLKMLTELGWIRYLALPLEPVMRLAGLPTDLGIVWATGIMVNIYSALIVFASLLPDLPALSQAQAAGFALMLLFAHSLPAEGGIAQRCGISFTAQCAIRLVVAVFGGVFVHVLCQAFGWLQAPAVMAFHAKAADPDLSAWALGELRNLAGIFCIICAVMLLQRLLKYCKVADLLGVVLKPVLRLLGLGPAAATTVVIGMVTGLLYGSGIIIREARRGELTPHEVFAVVTLMSLAHALIEDTLLMLLIGANILIVLFLRAAIALAVGVAFNQIYARTRGKRVSDVS